MTFFSDFRKNTQKIKNEYIVKILRFVLTFKKNEKYFE